MPRRLYARIYLHFLLMLLVVGPLSLGIFATGWRSAFVRASAERLAVHAASEVGEHWHDPAARLRVIRRLSDELNLDITVRDAHGALLVAVGPELPQPRGRDRLALREGPTVISDGRTWFTAAPVLDRQGGQGQGQGIAREPQGILEAALQRRFRVPPLWRPVLVVGLVLLVVAMGAAPLARRISRPVERLTAATRRFGSGELGYRLQPPWPWRKGDELGELTQAWNDMAERIETLVGGQKELLANVSHELRSPLARLRMALELLPVAPEGASRVRDMEDDLGELERLIDDLLTASRLEARAQSLMTLVLTPVDAHRLLLTLSERAARDTRFAEPLVVDGHPDAEGPWALADAELLGRALWNLVENAAKYGAPPIRVGAERAGERIRFHVSDEGPGIPESERERVFEPFYRADRARTPGIRAGVGLGLTLARRIAEAHGGTIHIASALGERGCWVTMELPAADERPAAGGP